jgi:hypothetical protein
MAGFLRAFLADLLWRPFDRGLHRDLLGRGLD